jgi:transposase
MSYVTKEFDRNQLNLIPISFDEMIDENNPVRVIEAFVEMLDMEKMNYNYAIPSKTGRPPYNPKDMLKLYVYGYFNGIRTSRKLERECKRNIELMWLLKNLTPDDKTISDFRKDNKKAVISAFKQFSMLCQELNLIGKEIVAIDGSKFRACNSRHKSYTKNKVARMLKYYEECAKKYMELLETDEPIENITELNQKLEKALVRIKELNEMAVVIEEKGEISITDPDARHMSVSNNGTDISHNVQTAVDEKHHLIVALDVTSNAQDNGQLTPMAEMAKAELGVDEITVLADKGYYNGKCLKYCQENGIKAIVSKQKHGSQTGDENYSKDKFIYNKEKDIFICPQGHELKCVSSKSAKQIKYKTKECKNCHFRDNCTKNDRGREIIINEYHENYLKADELFAQNVELYKKRQMIVEHPFGTIKRALGYTYFLTIGNENVKNESYLHCLTYNLKRVHNGDSSVN